MKIGFLDSGVGGLSVLKAFIHYPIHADYIYIADSGHLPYGLKSSEYIHNRIKILTQFLLTEYHIDMLVIACNTATAISAKQLRIDYPNFPIIGIEPAIKPAAQASKTKEVAILATLSMIQSSRLTDLIDRFAHEVKVHKIVADNWVKLVENSDFKSDTAIKAILETLKPIQNSKVDQIILGCTHFPFLQDSICKVVDPSITLLNPADAVAKYAIHQLEQMNLQYLTNENSFHYYTTGDLSSFKEQIIYFDMPYGIIDPLNL